MRGFRLPGVALNEVEPMGAGSSPDLPFFDRGTWEQSVMLGRPSAAASSASRPGAAG